MGIDDEQQRQRWDAHHGDIYTGHSTDEETPEETSPPEQLGTGWRPSVPRTQRTIDDDDLVVADATGDDTY